MRMRHNNQTYPSIPLTTILQMIINLLYTQQKEPLPHPKSQLHLAPHTTFQSSRNRPSPKSETRRPPNAWSILDSQKFSSNYTVFPKVHTIRALHSQRPSDKTPRLCISWPVCYCNLILFLRILCTIRGSYGPRSPLCCELASGKGVDDKVGTLINFC